MYFDLECKPGHWIGGDFVSKIVTAGAYAIDDGMVRVLTHYETTPGDIAKTIRDEILQSDVVIGHWIRGFDLALLNGELRRNNLEQLHQVMTVDTKSNLYSSHGRSGSQENLAAELGIEEKKLKVTLREWEDFNGREPGGEQKGVERVRDDVLQNRAMHQELLARGLLAPMKLWEAKPSSGKGYRG